MYLIDIAIPGDTRMVQKSVEKIDKYTGLKVQIGRCWKLESFVIPIIIGVLGSVPKDLIPNFNRLLLHTSIAKTAEQSVLYSTAHILRRHLSMQLLFCFVPTPFVRERSFLSVTLLVYCTCSFTVKIQN